MTAQNLTSVVRWLLPLLTAGLLTACAYKIDVQQGNAITQKEIAQLEKGMTKREVRYVLGTPLIADPFHQDRWDYFYSFKKGRQKEPEKRHITIVFVNDRLDRIEGDVVTPGADSTVADTDGKNSGGTKVTEPQQDKGFIRRTWDKVWGDD